MGSEKKGKEKLGRSQFILMFFAFSFGMILSNLLAQSSAQTNKTQVAPLFIYQGIDKTLDDVSPDIKERLESLYRKERHLIELAALEFHTHQYAQDQQVSIAQASEALFSMTKLDETKVSKFYQDNQAKIAKPFYEVKAQITAQLQGLQIKKVKTDLLKDLLEKGDIVVLPGR